MRRRDFIATIGGAAAAPITWPVAAQAQLRALPTVGFLAMQELNAEQVAAFRKGLSETGYTEDRNVAIEFRSAHNEPARLSRLAADLVGRRVSVIATLGGPLPVLAVKAANATIPIVFETGGDPVQSGLVASFNRPGGNATGVSVMNVEIEAKRLGLLHEMVPGASRFAILANPDSLGLEARIASLQAAASTIGRQVELFYARSNREIDTAFASLVQKRVDALLLSTSALFFDRRVQVALLAARDGLPSMGYDRGFAEAGGLMSYATNYTDQVRQVGVYTGRILRGDKPADLPVMQPIKFEFVINLQTARTIGIEVPPLLLAIADAVIE